MHLQRKVPIDCVLSDWEYPLSASLKDKGTKDGGRRALSSIRKADKNVPIIIMTGSDLDKVRNACRAEKIDPVQLIAKKFGEGMDIDFVVATVRGALNQNRSASDEAAPPEVEKGSGGYHRKPHQPALCEEINV